jgi:parallel beta-helix repeat protein
MQRIPVTIGMALAALAAGAGPAAATETVDDDGVQCPSATHTTIQGGVNAASPNEQVVVCNGVYREQVRIEGAAKNGVDVLAKTTRGATIKAPSTPLTDPESLVYINNVSNAKIRRFIIAGPGPGTVDSLRHGVLVENNADPGEKPAQVLFNLIVDIRDTEAAANEEGIGVRVGRNYAGTKGRAVVNDNEIVRYQRGGVVVDGDGSYALVSRNIIRGLGLLTSPVTPVPAQQGIQISRNGAADVATNRISENQYSGSGGDASPGILVFNTDRLTPAGTKSRYKTNTVTNNDYGILAQDSRNQNFETNHVRSNGDTGTVAGDGGIAIFETGAGLGGGNIFKGNDARTNAGLDCEDGTTGGGTAGTGNTWTQNRGADDNPAAICAP